MNSDALLITLLEQEGLHAELIKLAKRTATQDRYAIQPEELETIGWQRMADALEEWSPDKSGELKSWLLNEARKAMRAANRREQRWNARHDQFEALVPDDTDEYTDTDLLDAMREQAGEAHRDFVAQMDVVNILDLLDEDINNRHELWEVLWLFSRGHSDHKIAEQLGRRQQTVSRWRVAALGHLRERLATDRDSVLQSLREPTRMNYGDTVQHVDWSWHPGRKE